MNESNQVQKEIVISDDIPKLTDAGGKREGAERKDISMGVNVRCEVCSKFIRRVETKDIGSIQTDEICDNCGKRISETYGDLRDGLTKFRRSLNILNVESLATIKKARTSVEKLHGEFIETFNKSEAGLKRDHARYTNEMDALFKRSDTEIMAKIKRMRQFCKV